MPRANHLLDNVLEDSAPFWGPLTGLGIMILSFLTAFLLRAGSYIDSFGHYMDCCEFPRYFVLTISIGWM